MGSHSPNEWESYLLLVLEKGELVSKRKDRSPNTGDFEDGWGGAESPSRVLPESAGLGMEFCLHKAVSWAGRIEMSQACPSFFLYNRVKNVHKKPSKVVLSEPSKLPWDCAPWQNPDEGMNNTVYKYPIPSCPLSLTLSQLGCAVFPSE